MPEVMACIDDSASAPAVCDYAAWASLRLNVSLSFLHVLEPLRYPGEADLSGNVWLRSRDSLLQELASVEERRNRQALEQGRLILNAAKERAMAAGIRGADVRQREGELAERLHELENEIELLVIGARGEEHANQMSALGSKLESVVRAMHRPILVTPFDFKAPESVLLAFDGSATMRQAVATLAASSLLQGLPIHLVMIGSADDEHWAQLDAACDELAVAGFTVHTAIRPGEVESTLHLYQTEQRIDLLVIGAYGHSRLRQFLVGSSTARMLRTTRTPLLVVR
ncbi:universal stress protein [Pseudomonas sp. BN102]|uniref:universal stress protein n=1 Tax=Pseudomonas sp. BN102 TaxID=2567886 RepID=UPI0024566AFA|nr:universal stress protein [Pseudomonas sp. BN102]MDH4612396.1 universal stress protein [Pseudomonas sp. BN102]